MSDGRFTFTGTLIEGPDLDLEELSGLALSDAEWEAVWNKINHRDLVLSCPSCMEIELDEVDEIPGQSDSYFEYDCDDRDLFIAELRSAILSILRS